MEKIVELLFNAPLYKVLLIGGILLLIIAALRRVKDWFELDLPARVIAVVSGVSLVCAGIVLQRSPPNQNPAPSVATTQSPSSSALASRKEAPQKTVSTPPKPDEVADEKALSSAQAYARGRDHDGGGKALRNPDIAAKWYRIAAQSGHADAQYRLGMIISRTLKPSDEREAAQWFRKAGEQGHTSAMHQLGKHYEMGLGIAPDKAQAMKWHRQAAENGNTAAQSYLGWLYEGSGVALGMVPQVDYEEAAKWYRLASSDGSQVARERLERAEKMARQAASANK